MNRRSQSAPSPKRANSSAVQGRTDEQTVVVESLAAGGAGVARLDDGLRVFIPGTAVGERIVAAIDRHAKPARGRLLRVIEPSAERRDPPCAHVAECGGCDFMHLSDAAQQAAHAEIVRSAVAHAISSPLPVVRIHSAPEPLAYRTRARLYMRGERGKVRVGYRAAASHQLAHVRSCAVLSSSIARAFDDLPQVFAKATGDGDVQISRGADGRLCLDVAWRGDLPAVVWSAIDQRVRAGEWAGARVRLEGVKAPAVFGDPRPVLEGADGAPLVIASGSFAQPSDRGAQVLARRVIELSRANPEEPDEASLGTVVELFSGSGTFSVLLARASASFFAVESDEEAAIVARQNLAARGLSGKVTVADADAYTLPNGVDLVVLDPPRSGAPGASRAIASSRATRVVYVSCDPATLARDLAVIEQAGFVLTHLETVELFPQTSHVETIARLVRDRGTRARRD